MKRSAITTIIVAGLVLAACGSDSGSGGDVQSDVADMTVEQAAEAGVTLDKDCVGDIAEQLSDDDANAILSGNDEDVSEEGSLLSIDIVDCIED